MFSAREVGGNTRRECLWSSSGCNSVGRVSASQAECRAFEPRHPLQRELGPSKAPVLFISPPLAFRASVPHRYWDLSGFRIPRDSWQRQIGEDSLFSRLYRRETCAQLSPAFLKQASLLAKGDAFIDVGTRPEVGTEFIIGCAEARRCGEGTEAQHGIGALLDATVIVLNTIVHRTARVVLHVGTACLPDRPG